MLKLNAEKAPFFVEKLSIRVLPTIMIFKNGVASLDRIVGFEGLFEDQIDGKQENFSTNTVILYTKNGFYISSSRHA